MGAILDGYPWWSQLTDPDPRTGRPDVWASTDCGEEVCSIWIAGETGKYTDAADLRRQLVGIRADGRTTAEDLVHLLAKHGVTAEVTSLSVRELESFVHGQVALFEPVALLGNWVSSSILHWVLGIGFGNDALLAMEPWTGRLVAYRWSVVQSVATGVVVQHKP